MRASVLVVATVACLAWAVPLASGQRVSGLHESCPCIGDPQASFEAGRHDMVVQAKVLSHEGKRATAQVEFRYHGCTLQPQEEFRVRTKGKCRLNWVNRKKYLMFLVRKNGEWVVGQRCTGNRRWRDVGPSLRRFFEQHIEASCLVDRSDRTTQAPPVVTTTQARPAGLDQLPSSVSRGVDLAVDVARLAWNLEVDNDYFTSRSCAVRERCTRPGNRKLLRFSVGVMNVGSRDLVFGRLRNNPFGRTHFEYDTCHRHYHFIGFSSYHLRHLDGNDHFDGHKQSFCLTDSAQNPGDSRPRSGYSCSYQGISAGWMDVYGSNLDCQWVDITDMRRPGKYRLIVDLDPGNIIGESNRRNNRGAICVWVDPNRNTAVEVVC
eukprot:m.117608 g.117608  ORF g.117608 m.117608 type:complete len:377 (+) comp16403_c0_seq4:120-1250(+)